MTEPIHIISLGAGVQSSTMALMSAHGEITPMPKCAIFADTQDEPEAVYRWLDWIEKELPFPVRRISKGRLSDTLVKSYWSRKHNRKAFYGLPAFLLSRAVQGLMSRQCTMEFKVHPIQKEITKIMRENNARRVVQWIGISLDEIYRMKQSRRAVVEHRYPLVDSRMKRHDCLRWMERNGYPAPPRSACIYCPYRSNREWRDLTTEEFITATQFERKLQNAHRDAGMKAVPFLHRSMIPLGDVDFSTDEDHGQQVMFGNECEGMCGV
jgi:hypothetical protein